MKTYLMLLATAYMAMVSVLQMLLF